MGSNVILGGEEACDEWSVVAVTRHSQTEDIMHALSHSHNQFILSFLSFKCNMLGVLPKCKGKGKVHPRTDKEGPEGE